MSLFWKIFSAILLSLAVVTSIITYGVTVRQISREKEGIVEAKRSISTFLGREIERGYLQSRWPFESLNRLSEEEDFRFWWIVRDDGTIHLADQAAFMSTDAYAHFSELARPTETRGLILHWKGKYGIFVEPLNIGEKRWNFVLGFSTERISAVGIRAVVTAIVFFLLTFSFLGLILYLVLRYHTRSLGALVAGAEAIRRGNLTYRVKVESKDEVGRLADFFNRMVEDLEKTTVSRDYMDSILSHLNEALIVLDPSRHIKRINRAACDLLGYLEEELLDQPIGKVLVSPEGTFLSGEGLGKGARNLAPVYGETLLRARDGKEIPVLLGSSPIRDDEGELRWIVCAGMDITERKRSENALRESEARYRAVVEQSADCIFLVDAESKRIVEANSPFLNLLGYTPAEILGVSIYDFVAADRDQISQRFQDILSGKAPLFYERQFRRKDGSLVDVWVSSKAISYAGRKMVCTVTRDLTERKRAEQALRESEERYRTVVEQSADGINLVDAESKRIVEANTAFAKILGYSLEEILGLSIYDFVAAEREDIDQRYQNISLGGQSVSYERQFRRKDGSLLSVWVSATPIYCGGRKLTCHITRDITERKQAEQERERFIDELQEALANIKTLRGLVPICAHCKKIRDDQGYWQQVETYVQAHSEAEFSHGLCPECIRIFFPEPERGKGKGDNHR